MSKFPLDAPKAKVLKTLESLGFVLVREGNHLALVRQHPDGTKTPLTLPNHDPIKTPCAAFLRNQEFPETIS